MYRQKALIEPRRGRSERSLPPFGMLILTERDIEDFLIAYGGELDRSHRIFLSNVFVRSCSNARVAVAGPILGAPQAVLVLEKMIALGVRDFLVYGWCGSLQKDVRIGDIILPKWAISEEGTSRHYPVGGRPGADLEFYARVLSALKESSGEYVIHQGGVWTTDAPYRETVDKVIEYQSEGILGVEMETSALFTVASYRKARVASILIVSDELSSLEWKPGYRDKRFHSVRQSLMRDLWSLVPYDTEV